jgi:hypothetical protein
LWSQCRGSFAGIDDDSKADETALFLGPSAHPFDLSAAQAIDAAGDLDFLVFHRCVEDG